MNFLNWWSESPWLGCALLVFICSVLEGCVRLIRFAINKCDPDNEV